MFFCRYHSFFCALIFICIASVSCSKKSDSGSESIEKNIEKEVVIAPDNRLPQIILNTNGESIPDEPKIDATMVIEKQGVVVYEGNIAIEIRGQSSQMFPKKQYGFEIRDENNEGIDVSLLELPEEEDWILHAPYSDKSLIRNALIYDLSRSIGRYTSRFRFVELILNDSNEGLYILMEKLKRDNNRIDINKLKESENEGEDLTGGYILKIDKNNPYNDSNSFISSVAPHSRILFDTPDEEDITQEQRNYISTYVHDFETALAGDNFTDPAQGYAPYIDSDSFIDFFLLNELSNNVDGFRLSTWVVKDKNKPLSMGPIWDFNLAFGNADYCRGGDYNVWAYRFNERCPGDQWQIPFWWHRLLEDPAWLSQVQARWNDLRGAEFSETEIHRKIDEYVTLLTASGSSKSNFTRWQVLNEYVWPNNYVGGTYEMEIFFLKEWISNRLQWLDENIMNL